MHSLISYCMCLYKLVLRSILQCKNLVIPDSSKHPIPTHVLKMFVIVCFCVSEIVPIRIHLPVLLCWCSGQTEHHHCTHRTEWSEDEPLSWKRVHNCPSLSARSATGEHHSLGMSAAVTLFNETLDGCVDGCVDGCLDWWVNWWVVGRMD